MLIRFHVATSALNSTRLIAETNIGNVCKIRDQTKRKFFERPNSKNQIFRGIKNIFKQIKYHTELEAWKMYRNIGKGYTTHPS